MNNLKDKAIKIQGKDYVLVADRVNYFNVKYPNGSIRTRLISPYDSDTIVIQAIVTPDVDKPERKFVDYAQELVGSSFINKTSAMENASTSAVGRALGFMGIGVIESIASADEINKATNRMSGSGKKATPKQVQWIRDTARKLNDQLGDDKEVDEWVESILTLKPEQIPVYKVKDAVDKLKEPEPTVPIPDPELTDEEMDKALRDLKDGKLPY